MRLRSNRDTEMPSKEASRPPSSVTNSSGGARKRKVVGGKTAGGPLSKKIRKMARGTAVDEVACTSSRACGAQKEGGGSKTTGRKHKLAESAQRSAVRISDIPEHIMVSVFSILPIVDRVKAERVCRRWRYLAKNYAWSQTRTFSYSTLVEQRACSPFRYTSERPLVANAEVKSLARRCGRFLRHLDLHAFRDTLTYNVCASFAAFCPNLSSLNLLGIQLTNSSVQLLGRHCSNLEQINFHRCFQESVVERGLSSFFAKCVRLKVVDVGENERLCGIPSFSMLPNSINTLKISGCYRLASAAMEAIKTRCPNLSYLVMDNVDTLSPSELNSFFSSLENLRKLKFSECFISHTIGGADLNLSRMKNLTELIINDNLLITDSVLRTLVSGCKELKCVDVSGCNRFVTNAGLFELAKLPSLTHLNLSMMRITSDETIRIIAHRGMLQALLLHRCDDITDVGIADLLKLCKKLTSLDLSFCPKVTDASLNAMVQYVAEREKKEASLPLRRPIVNAREDQLLSQMMPEEGSLETFMEEDFAGQMLRFQTENRARQHASFPSTFIKDANGQKASGEGEGFTELHVWLGHSGITQPCVARHRLLKVNEKESLADPPSVLQLRVVIRIN